MINTKMFLISMLVFITSISYAGEGGSTAGNGGHGVDCRKTSQHYELLDLFELDYLYGVRADLNLREGYSPRDAALRDFKIRRALKLTYKRSLELGNPEFSAIVKKAESARGRITFRSDEDLPVESDDAGELNIPKDCSLTQLAYRSRDEKGRITIMIPRIKYQSMPLTEITALVLHETLHDWFSQVENYNSTLPLRQIVGYLSAPDAFRSQNKTAAQLVVQTKQPKIFQ